MTTPAESSPEPRASTAAHSLDQRRRGLFLTAFAPALAWGVHLLTSYGLVYPAGRTGSKVPLLIVTVICLATSVTATWSGLRLRRTSHGASGSEGERDRFVADTAALLGAFFSLVILAQTLPVALLGFHD